jgi:RimJ/RimL family protein N-acetyltransferase
VIPELPDLPRWVEAHAIAADPASWRIALGAGLAVGDDRSRLIVVAGDATPEDVAALARDRASYVMLLAIERADLVARLRADGRDVVRAILHVLTDPDALPELEGALPLPDDASLAHLPEALAAELAEARAHATIWSAWVDGEPVSFAYAASRTPRWFDIGVDTAPGARQLGLATLVAAAMIRDERARGREPVWGADEDNLASLRLAARLGFTPIDALWIVAAT